MATRGSPTPTEVRCECGRKLATFESEIAAGRAEVTVVCPRCKRTVTFTLAGGEGAAPSPQERTQSFALFSL